MSMKLKKLLLVIFLLVGLGTGAYLGMQALSNAAGSERYSDAAALAYSGETAPTETLQTLPAETVAPKTWIPAPIEDEDPHLETLEAIDLEALRQVNGDVIGWIFVPDSPINYPLMQGQDNDYYLNNTWDKVSNSVGSIFMEHRNSADLTDYNTIIYGHNMNNGSMFGSLRRYTGAQYRKERPYIYIVTDAGVYRYEVYSFYKAAVDSFTYGLSFNEAATRANFLVESQRASQASTGVRPEITDRILTLSTCAGGGYTHRWVVQARLKMIQTEG